MINENSLIYDVILEHPETKKVFRKYGIRCFGWGSYAYYSIGNAAKIFGLEPSKLVDELNKEMSYK